MLKTTENPRAPFTMPRHSLPLRVLVVSYSFPPVGGAGVQRMLKLVKYLPKCGVSPTVLTVRNPSVPLRDQTLEQDVPAQVEVLRARTLEPDYGVKQAAWSAASPGAPSPRQRAIRLLAGAARQLLWPDPQVLWQPFAQATLLRRLWAGLDDVLIISGPPFSPFLLTLPSRLREGVAVVLDYRDEWSTCRAAYEMTGGALNRLLGRSLEATLLRRAHRVVTATPEFRDNLLRQFSFLGPEQVQVIENGYDPDDFPAELPAPPQDRFTITYAGTVFRLTSAQGLLGAVRLLHRDEPELARLLRLRFLGRIVDTELPAFAGSEALGVERLGYLDHRLALAEQSRSHLTLCILDDVPGTERIYPGKIFELMYLGRPCLVLAPTGALSRLSERHGLGPALHPWDEARIAAALATALRQFRDGTYEATARPRDIERFHRRAQADAFAAVLREAKASAAPMG